MSSLKVTGAGGPRTLHAVLATAVLFLSCGAARAQGITVSITPAQAGVTVMQNLSLAATTNDSAGVTWSISPTRGRFSPATSLSGSTVNLTVLRKGIYTVTATSVTSSTVSASMTLGVTGLAGVTTYHYQRNRTGTNTEEFALTPANVNTNTFGKLFSCPVDGAVYAQPLWVSNLSVNGITHNVLFVATAHDSLFAFDADQSPCTLLWQVSLIDANHGGTTEETTIPDGTSGNLVGSGFGDITPEVGVIGTPVIELERGILYVVSQSVNVAGPVFYQRLHAINMATGAEEAGAPALIAASFAGQQNTVAFSPRQQNQRAGLALIGRQVYIAWGSHEDNDPWYGWLMSYTYNGRQLVQHAALNVTPDTGEGGIWMAGGAPSVDDDNHLYVITGNGNFDVTNTSGPTDDYGDSFLQLTPGLSITSWFSPSDEQSDDEGDRDFGSGGSAMVLNTSSGSVRHLVVGGGKDGTLYVLNGDSMGGSGDSNARQNFNIGHGIFGTLAFWGNTLYLAPAGGPMQAYAFNAATNLFSTTPTSQSATSFGWPGSTPAVSSNGGSNGIVWGINSNSYCTNQSQSCGPAVLHAYAASSLANELWNSSMVPTDAAGNAVKFTVPTVANGKVYVGTRGNNTGGLYGSSSVSGEVDVYGLKPN